MKNDLISRRAIFHKLLVYGGKVCPDNDIDGFPITIKVRDIKKAIRDVPSVGIQPERHGLWLDSESPLTSSCKCSLCSRYFESETPYCPHCGAKMDEKEVVKKDYNPCNKCTHKGWNMPQCQYCNKANGYKYAELDTEKFMESKNVPERKDGE